MKIKIGIIVFILSVFFSRALFGQDQDIFSESLRIANKINEIYEKQTKKAQIEKIEKYLIEMKLKDGASKKRINQSFDELKYNYSIDNIDKTYELIINYGKIPAEVGLLKIEDEIIYTENSFNKIFEANIGSEISESIKNIKAASSKAISPQIAWQTQFIDALGNIIAARFKQELTVAFFSDFKKKLETIEELQILFPTTRLVLLQNDPFDFNAFLSSLRAAFKKDFDDMLSNLVELALKKKDSAGDREEIEIAAMILKIMQGIKDGKMPAKLIEETVKLIDENKFENKTVGPIKLLAVISSNLINPETGAWLKKSELEKKYEELKKNRAQFKALILLAGSTAGFYGITIDNVDSWINYFSRLFSALVEIQERVAQISENAKDGKTIGFNDFCLISDSMEQLIQNILAFEDTKYELPESQIKIAQIYQYARLARSIYSNFNSGDIGAAGIQLLAFIQKVIPRNKFVLNINLISEDFQTINRLGNIKYELLLFTKLISESLGKREADYRGKNDDISEYVLKIISFLENYNVGEIDAILPFTRDNLNQHYRSNDFIRKCLNIVLDRFWDEKHKSYQDKDLREEAKLLIGNAKKSIGNLDDIKINILSVYLARYYNPIINEAGIKYKKNAEDIPTQLDLSSKEIEAINRFDLISKIRTQITDNPKTKLIDLAEIITTYFIHEHYFADNKDLYARITKYTNFAVNLLLAKNSGDVQKVLESVVLPVGSYIMKRSSKFSLSINSYTGIFPSLSSFAKKIDPENQLDDIAQKQGLTLQMPFSSSIGFSFDFGLKKHTDSINVFVPLIDIGSLVAIRLSGNIDEIPPLTMTELWSPGLFVLYGFKNKPYTIGFGCQFGPIIKLTKTDLESREEGDPTSKIEAVTQTKAFRVGIVMAIDIPIFSLIKVKHR